MNDTLVNCKDCKWVNVGSSRTFCMRPARFTNSFTDSVYTKEYNLHGGCIHFEQKRKRWIFG